MNKFKLITILTLTTLAPFAWADVSITGTLTSDYVFRGISQTDSSPAVQASLDYEHESGFFSGVWASNIDFGDDADAEINLYAGYFSEVNESLSYDISYTYYAYTGYSSEEDYDYGEIILNGYIYAFTLTFSLTSDYANSGDAAQYIGVAYDFDLPNEYALALQGGYTMGNAWEDSEYIDYGATVSRIYNGFDVSAAIINTDIDDDDTADVRFVLSVERTF